MHSSPFSRALATRRLRTSSAIIAGAIATLACERAVSATPQTPQAIVDTASTTLQSVVPADSALRFPDVPNSVRTPGTTLDVTAADICVSGYAKRVRNVPSAVKRQAYASYGVRSHEPGEYEIDHLISLSLGGSNSIRNLWPESFRTQPWNAYVKDELENELHRRVCAGRIELAKAQYVISHNWIIGYRIYVHTKPTSAQARRKTRSRSRRSYSPPRSQFDPPVP